MFKAFGNRFLVIDASDMQTLLMIFFENNYIISASYFKVIRPK